MRYAIRVVDFENVGATATTARSSQSMNCLRLERSVCVALYLRWSVATVGTRQMQSLGDIHHKNTVEADLFAGSADEAHTGPLQRAEERSLLAAENILSDSYLRAHNVELDKAEQRWRQRNLQQSPGLSSCKSKVRD